MHRERSTRPLHQADVSQQAVIHATGNALRVVAPAGSGKTETVVRRVIHRIEHDGIDPRRILMLTFDNNGQQSLKRMLRKLGRTRGYPTFQTFNKFGLGLLNDYFPGEAAPTVKLPDVRELRLAIGAFPILTWDERRRDVIDLFRAMKDQGFRPDPDDRERAVKWLRSYYLELPEDGELFDFDEGGGFKGTDTDAVGDIPHQLDEVFDGFIRYERELRALGKMDVQDQKLRPLIRLVRSTKARELARQTYDEIIVDEAQDISRLDALLIWCVMGPQTTITLAGDDDQTIYEFKQASSVFLRDAAWYFKRDPFETFLLSTNYRSPEAILAPAQRLISHNVERIEKSVAAARSDLGEVIVQASATPEARVRSVVDWIVSNAGQPESRFAWSDIGILAPSQGQLDAFDLALQAKKIPTKINTGRNDDGTIVNAVELGTIHKAKGRQWAVVFLPMSGEGEVPTVQNVRQGNLEAERRAYYVSMSRAADVLVVGYVRRDAHDTIARSMTDEIIGTSGASRFLFEAGLVTEWHPPIEEPAPVVGDTSSPSRATTLVDRLRQRRADDLQRMGRIAGRASEPARVATIPAPVPEAVVAERSKRHERRGVATEDVSFSVPQSWIDLISKAERNLEVEQQEYALYDGWRVIVEVLNLLDDGGLGEKPEAFELINRLEYTGTMTRTWANRLHQWRKTRNRGFKENRFDPKAIEDLVRGLRPLIAEVTRLRTAGTSAPPGKRESEVAPVPAVAASAATAAAAKVVATPPAAPAPIDASGPTLYKIPTDRVMHVLGVLNAGGYDPERGRVIRQIGFHTVNAGVEFLPLQLGMILFGIRFFVPQTFRYASSPIFARFCERHCAALLPDQLRRTAKVSIAPDVRRFESRIHDLMREVLDHYVEFVPGRVDIDAMLANRLESADVLQNGMNTSGVILEPLSSSRYPRPSWTKRS